MRGIAVALAIVLGAGAVLTGVGCSSWFARSDPGGEWKPRGGPIPMEPAPGGPARTEPVTPSVEATSDRVEVTGRLLYIDDGDGLFWAISDDTADPLASGIPPLVAVIANPKDLPVDTLVGLLVRVAGVPAKGPARIEGVMMLDAEKIESASP